MLALALDGGEGAAAGGFGVSFGFGTKGPAAADGFLGEGVALGGAFGTLADFGATALDGAGGFDAARLGGILNYVTFTGKKKWRRMDMRAGTRSNSGTMRPCQQTNVLASTD